MQWWDQLVKVTGSSLNTKKCCTIAYEWNPDTHGILQLEMKTPRNAIVSTIDNSSPPPIKFAKMDEGIHYLGVYITGNQTT